MPRFKTLTSHVVLDKRIQPKIAWSKIRAICWVWLSVHAVVAKIRLYNHWLVGRCVRPCQIGILLSVNSSLTNLGTYSQKHTNRKRKHKYFTTITMHYLSVIQKNNIIIIWDNGLNCLWNDFFQHDLKHMVQYKKISSKICIVIVTVIQILSQHIFVSMQ